MSWSAFDEFKTFASKVKDQCKRKKDWNKPSSKKQKSLSSAEEESGIDRFSSDEEHEETCAHRPTYSGKHKLKSPSKQRSPSDHNPRKRIRTDNELGDLIDDSEGTPEDNQSTTKQHDIGNTVKYRSDYNGSGSDEANQLMETLDVMIKDFNSSDEEKQEDEELNIESPTPTPTPSSNSTPPPSAKQPKMTETSVTGSEWLKRLQSIASKSKEEDSTTDVIKTDVDSAKKTRQKFKRSGLAEQLQKVINREKSEKTFWAHKQSTGIQDTVSTLDVQILSLQVQHSLCITRCCVLSSKDDKPTVVDVVFDAETSRQLVPRVGSAVRIHPPWQKLHPPLSPYPVLLCTYYCEKLPTPPGSPVVDLASLTDASVITNEQPDKGFSHLTQSPHKVFKPTKLLFESNTVNGSTAPSRSSTNKVYLPSIAKAIETQGGCSGESVSFHAVIQRIYRRRVKIPRDKTIESPGHLALSKSLITRARNGEDKEETRWTLLVQDSTFNLCEVQIPAELAEKDEWISCIKSGEGRLYNFVDIMISQRANRTRLPSLFSVVDSLWCAELSNCSQEDRSSQIQTPQEMSSQLSLPLSSPPSHCYMLTAQEDSHVTPCDGQDVTTISSLYKSPSPVSLRELCLHHDTPKRFSVWCRVICSRPSSSTRTVAPLPSCQSWTGQLFVTDASLHCGETQSTQETQMNEGTFQYVKIDVRPSFVMSEEINKAVLEAGSVLYLQDIVCNGIDLHVVYADSYTSIKKGATDPCQVDLDTGDIKGMPLSIYSDLVALRTQEFILPLSPASSRESLCKVEGVVTGVDEESACCWLECAVCACQDLLERSGLPYFCPVCQDDVPDPVTKTNLEVIIKCDLWCDARVTVKLLQSTIEHLLPVSYQDSDQGYDIERVLGKRLGPLYCYIEEHGELTAKLSEIVVSL